jgi:DNA-binding NarL/FixJ family response regulator
VRVGLEAFPDLLVIGEAASAANALETADSALPDIVLIDAQLRTDNSLDLTKQLKRRHPQMLVVLMTRAEDDEQLFQAIRSGAAAYILVSSFPRRRESSKTIVPLDTRVREYDVG